MGDAVQETVDAVQDTEPDRWLQLEGLDNVRDAGGLPLRDGGRTRFGELLRSASLRYLTDDDVAHLVDVVGLRMVIDLRTAREIDRDGPTAVAARGVETVPLSFIPEEGTELPETGDDTDPLLRAYLGYLVDRTENVVHAVRLLGRSDAGPTLVHCAAGKDRTGVLLALVLDAVGVEREAVIADYALSAQHVEAMFRAVDHGVGPGDARRPHPAPAPRRGDRRGPVQVGRRARPRRVRRRPRLAAGERARRRLGGATAGAPHGPVNPGSVIGRTTRSRVTVME